MTKPVIKRLRLDRSSWVAWMSSARSLASRSACCSGSLCWAWSFCSSASAASSSAAASAWRFWFRLWASSCSLERRLSHWSRWRRRLLARVRSWSSSWRRAVVWSRLWRRASSLASS
ncbi:MAG: hypothetical protein ACLUNZ_05905 [Evtepia sp.]